MGTLFLPSFFSSFSPTFSPTPSESEDRGMQTPKGRLVASPWRRAGRAERERRGCVDTNVGGQTCVTRREKVAIWPPQQILGVQCPFQVNPSPVPRWVCSRQACFPVGWTHGVVGRVRAQSQLGEGSVVAPPFLRSKDHPGSRGAWERRASFTSLVSLVPQAPL